MLVASPAHKDSIHLVSGAGWVEGFNSGTARFKWGLLVCKRGKKE